MAVVVSDLGMTMTQIARRQADEAGERWDMRFLALADQVSTWSKDPKTRVGAVIVGPDRRPYLGYNGPPSRVKDCPAMLDTDAKHDVMIHAELNAILNCPVPTQGMTLYTTHTPCKECAKVIVQKGITCVVTWEPSPRWRNRYPMPDIFWKVGMTLKVYQRPATAVAGASFSL